jgi:hypothetical protein
MVRLGSHQAAVAASTNFRLLGQTHSANVLLRRNLFAVSGEPSAHFTLHPDGEARAVDDCAEGEYPIECIRKEKLGDDGRMKYEVVYVGDWSYDEKYVWQDESDCNAADIASFRLEGQIKGCMARDAAKGITAHNSRSAPRRTPSRVISGRIQKPQAGHRSQAGHRPGRTNKTLAAARRAIRARITGQSYSPEQGSDSDCDAEDISEEEQAFYAARSAFGR